MSVKVSSLVWEFADNLAGSDLLVMLALAEWANDEGLCWPSIGSIAKKARVSERTAQYTVRSLAGAGYIAIDEQRGRGHTSTYTINLPYLNEKAQSLHLLEQEKVQNDVEKVQPSVEKVQRIAPDPLVRTVSIEPSTNAPKKGKRKSPMVECPHDFQVTDLMEARARKKGFRGNRLHLELITQNFLDYHASKGNRFASWERAWDTWIGKSIGYGEDLPRMNGSNGNGPHQQDNRPSAIQAANSGPSQSRAGLGKLPLAASPPASKAG